MTDVLVTFQHLRAAKYCAPGVKRWCERYGFDFRRFKTGVPASELLETGCPMALKVVEEARRVNV